MCHFYVIPRNHDNQLSPNLPKMCLNIREPPERGVRFYKSQIIYLLISLLLLIISIIIIVIVIIIIIIIIIIIMFLSKTVLSLFAITTAISTSHLCTFYFSPDFTFEIRVNEKWDDQLEDKDSEKYKKISTLLKEQVLSNTDVQHLLFSCRQSFSLANPFLIPFHVTHSLSSHCLAFTRASIVTYLLK